MKQIGNPAPPRGQRGQASIEYIVVVIAVVVILITKPDVVTDIVNALKDAYAAFVYAMSASDIPLS
ncbi:hypothetical protein [Thermomonas brevis]|jgi:Flp pilus assembly pilin Flp